MALLCPRGRGIKQIQKFYFLFRRQERRFKRITSQLAQVFVGEADRLLHQRKFLDQRRAKHRGVVAIQSQHQSLIEVPSHRMLRQFGTSARPQIAAHAAFNRNLGLSQLFDQFRILPSRQPMSNAFRLKVQRAPDRSRPSALTGMSCEMKTSFRATCIDSCEPFRRPRALVAADAERNPIAIMKLNGEIEHTLRFFGAELPNRIEDPQQRNAEVFFSALSSAFQALENCGEILLAPEADTDRNNDLRVQNILRLQPLHQTVRNQLVVFGRAQVSGHIFESREETGEVLVVVKLLLYGKRCSVHPVTLTKLKQGRRLDRAFKMQMQLGLRKREDEAGWLRRHTAIL